MSHRTSCVWAVAVAFLVVLSPLSAAEAGAPCSPSDYAPESILLLSEPGKTSAVIKQVPQDTATLVKVDAMSLSSRGDWLKVRSGSAIGWVSAKDIFCRYAEKQAREVIGTEADAVIRAIAAKDLNALSGFVHPVKGLRFSPHASIDEKSVVLTAAQVKFAFSDPARRVWGYEDGSEKPIRLTFSQYYQGFVYDRDFDHAPERRYNSFTAETTTQNTVWELYPSGIAVEFHIPGAKWASLRLVFEQQAGKWYLTAIVHDAWTI